MAIGRAGELDYLLVGTLGQLALLEVARNGPDDALPLAEEALDLASRRGWEGIPETAPAQLAAAAAALYGHRLDAAAAHLERRERRSPVRVSSSRRGRAPASARCTPRPAATSSEGSRSSSPGVAQAGGSPTRA